MPLLEFLEEFRTTLIISMSIRLEDKQALANAVVVPSRHLDVQQELIERALGRGPSDPVI